MSELGDTSGVSDAKSADSGGGSTEVGPVGGDGPARSPAQTAAAEARPEPKLDSETTQANPETSPEPKLDSFGTEVVDETDPLAGTKAETVEVTRAEEASESEAIDEGESAYEEYQDELRDGLKDVSDAIEETSNDPLEPNDLPESNDPLEHTQQMTGVADTQFLEAYQPMHDSAHQFDAGLNAALTMATVAAKWSASKRKKGGDD